jgi:ParB-like chromosome segregation protein Spo0J
MSNEPQIVSVPLPQIKVGERHRKDMGDLASLAASMKERGLLQPVAIRPDRTLVAGARRLEAARLLGWDRISVYVADGLEQEIELLLAERDENTCRKDFTPSEAVALGRAIEDRERPAARARQNAGRPKKEDKKEEEISKPNLAGVNGSAGKASSRAAEAVGMSTETYRKAKAVVEAAGAEPEKFGPLVASMDSSGKVDPAYQQVRGKKKSKRRAPGFRRLCEGAKKLLSDHSAAISIQPMEDLAVLSPPAQIMVARMLAERRCQKVKVAKDRLLDELTGNPLAAIKRLVPALTAEQRDELRQLLGAEGDRQEPVDQLASPQPC